MGIEQQFKSALDAIKSLPAQSNDILLNLYGLYKQATAGDVTGKKPGLLDLVGKAKFEAWASRRGLTREKAMEAYCKLVETLKGN